MANLWTWLGVCCQKILGTRPRMTGVKKRKNCAVFLWLKMSKKNGRLNWDA